MKSILAVVGFLMMGASVGYGQNVALGKPVTQNGLPASYTWCGMQSQPAAGTINNGSFLAETTCWLFGSFWTGTSANIVIDLQGTFTISSAIIQADNNDTYLVEYQAPDNSWNVWWNVPAAFNAGGVSTRPNFNQTSRQTLPTVSAKAIRVSATGGDDLYAVSELQVFGPASTPVGTPTLSQWGYIVLTASLMGYGLWELLRRKNGEARS